MPLKAVLFDYGDTLLSTRMNWDRVIPKNLAGLENTLKPSLPQRGFERLKRDFLFLRATGRKRAAEQHLETPAIETLRLALALQAVTGVEPEVLQAGVDGFFKAEEAHYSIIVGIPETLERLKTLGLKLIVVSNATCGRLIRRALQRRNLLDRFDLVVVSADVGVCKPDPAIFQPAQEALGLTTADCAMVGDRLDTDILGANRAGMRSVLADFHGDEKVATADGPMPNVVVRHPEALVSIFQAWKK